MAVRIKLKEITPLTTAAFALMCFLFEKFVFYNNHCLRNAF